MKRTSLTLLNTLVATLILAGWQGTGKASVSAEPDPSAVVAHLDSLRRPSEPNLRMHFTLTTSDGTSKDTYSYTGLLRKDSGSLVFADDGDQRGQKYLYTPSGYWLYAPRTRRPVRLTPLQTLRGQASIGDIARLDLGGGYTAALSNPNTSNIDGKDCWVFALTAKSTDVTYASITLYVGKNDQIPVQADLMSTSGHKLKTLKFGGLRKIGEQKLLTTLTYIDAVNPDKRTVQQIDTIEASDTPTEMFQPQALVLEK